MTSTSRMYLGLALVLLCAAPAAAQGTRDSAGVRIVENVRPAWAPAQAWRLSERPVLVLGGTGADDKLGRIAGLTRLSDGRVVVADQSSLQLRFYDASGRPLQSVGGTGPVPVVDGFRAVAGFQSIARLPGDSLAVESTGLAWIFTPAGTLARTVQFGPFAPGVLQTPYPMPLGRFGNGTTVVADYPQGRQGPAGARQWVDSASLFLADRGGAVARPLGRVPVVTFVAGANHAAPMDLGPQALWASSGNTFYWGFGDEYAIRAYDADWKLRRIVRRAWTPRPLTGGEIDAYVDGWLKMWSKRTGAELEAERREMRAGTYPDKLPAYSAILAGPTGEIWLREPDMTGAPGCWCLAGLSTVPSEWSVFDAEGRWLGQVAMPPRFIPTEVGVDYVLGRSREADDVTRAVMYRLEKPR